MQMGLSESARVTTAEESRFRIAYPNSRPRGSRIIALDAASMVALSALAGRDWNDARFLRFVAAKPLAEPLQMIAVDAELEDMAGNRVSLIDEIAAAAVIVMVVNAGSSAGAAQIIGNAAFIRNRLTTGLLLNSKGVSSEALTRTLRAMRPFASMLVVSAEPDFVGEMLSALKA